MRIFVADGTDRLTDGAGLINRKIPTSRKKVVCGEGDHFLNGQGEIFHYIEKLKLVCFAWGMEAETG